MKHTNSLSLIAGLLMLAASSAATAVAVSGQGTWETTLQARDINGDGKADAYYDTSTNLTWLADANLVKTSGYQGFGSNYPETVPLSSGSLHLEIAEAWAASLDVYGVMGWRLPTVVDRTTWTSTIPHSQNTTYAIEPGTSELENLFTLTLGNSGGQLTNTGLFENVQSGSYWTSTVAADFYTSVAWTYDPTHLTHGLGPSRPVGLPPEGYFAWAVHTGDVQAVPEPGTVGLMLLGGVLSVAVARRRTIKQPG